MENLYNNNEVKFSLKLSLNKPRLKSKDERLQYFLKLSTEDTEYNVEELVEYFHHNGVLIREKANTMEVVNGSRWEAYKRLLSADHSDGGKSIFW